MFAGEPPSSPDPTKRLCRRTSSVFEAFRRLVLQSGVANIAGAGSRWVVAFFVVSGGRRTCPSLLLSTAARDPGLIAERLCRFGWNIEVSATSTST